MVFGLTLAVAWVEYRAGVSRYNWDPLSDSLFGDLMEYPGTYRWLHTAAFFFNVTGRPVPYPMYSPVAYPPFAAMVMAGIYSAASPVLRYLEVAAAWLAVACGGAASAAAGWDWARDGDTVSADAGCYLVSDCAPGA